MPQCKAFRCVNQQGKGKVKKSFFRFPNPERSTEDRKTCQKWLDNLKNHSLPRKVDDYLWKRAHLVCEDHFAPDSFEHIKGAFASELADSLNYLQVKRLRRDAVPTIVNHDADCGNDTSCVDQASTSLAVTQQNVPLSPATVSASAPRQARQELDEARASETESWASEMTSSAVLSTSTETEAKSLSQERICCKEEDTITPSAVPSLSPKFGTESPSKKRKPDKEKDSTTSSAMPVTSAVPVTAVPVTSATAGTELPAKKKRHRKKRNTGQPPTAGAGCAEPREEVSTQTEELPREPWELGCGHAVTLQHFHHVIVAVGLDHAYSRRCAMLKALTSHAGPGHAFDVAVPLWLSISKALTAKALTAKALTAKSLIARAGLGDIVDVGAPPHISTPAMNSQVHDGHIVVTLTETSQDADHVSFTDNPHATLAGTSQIADHIGSEDNPHATLAGTSRDADHITLRQNEADPSSSSDKMDSSDSWLTSEVNIEIDVAEELPVSKAVKIEMDIEEQTDIDEDPAVSLKAVKIETEVVKEPLDSLKTVKTETDADEKLLSLTAVKTETDADEKLPISLVPMKLENDSDINKAPPVSMKPAKIQTDTAEKLPDFFETVKTEINSTEEMPGSMKTVKTEMESAEELPVFFETIKAETDIARKVDIVEDTSISVKMEIDGAQELPVLFVTVKTETDTTDGAAIAEEVPMAVKAVKMEMDIVEEQPVFFKPGENGHEPRKDQPVDDSLTLSDNTASDLKPFDVCDNESEGKQSRSRMAVRAEDVVKEERLAVMHRDDLSSPTGQQLNVLSSGSRTPPVEKDVNQRAQPPHHLQQAPYLQFEGQKDQQNLEETSHVIKKHSAKSPPAAIMRHQTVVQQLMPSAIISAPFSSLDRPHVCGCCSSAFVHFSSLQCHMVLFHREDLQHLPPQSLRHDTGLGNRGGVKTHSARQCVCTKTLTWANAAERGQRLQTAPKPLECDVHSQTFGQTNDLKSHKRMHASHKPFVCSVCSQTFMNHSRLKAHKRSRTNHKMASGVCSESFTLTSDPERHKETCCNRNHPVYGVCSESFTLTSDPERHKETCCNRNLPVHGVCSEPFAQTSDPERHKETRCNRNHPVHCVCTEPFAQTSDPERHKETCCNRNRPVHCACTEPFAQTSDPERYKDTCSIRNSPVYDVCSEPFIPISDSEKHKETHSIQNHPVYGVCSVGFYPRL